MAAPQSSAPTNHIALPIEPALIELGAAVLESVPVISSGRGVGSGIVWSADGLLVTNNHVATGSLLRVTVPGQDALTGQVIAREAKLDLALLKVEPVASLRLLVRGAGPTPVGSLGIAVGNPMGWTGVLTVGVIVSAPNQKSAQASLRAEGLIQTDTVLAPGNSGGPLLNATGQLIGINTLVMGHASFAIPVAIVESFVADALRESSRTTECHAVEYI